MSYNPPKDWKRESDNLYIHKSGCRVQHMTYRQKDGWFIVPVELSEAVVEFEATPEGRDKAFEHFEKENLSAKAKRKSAPKPKKRESSRKAKESERERPGEGEEGEGTEAAEEGEDDEEGEADEGEEEPKAGEGAETP